MYMFGELDTIPDKEKKQIDLAETGGEKAFFEHFSIR